MPRSSDDREILRLRARSSRARSPTTPTCCVAPGSCRVVGVWCAINALMLARLVTNGVRFARRRWVVVGVA